MIELFIILMIVPSVIMIVFVKHIAPKIANWTSNSSQEIQNQPNVKEKTN